MQLYHLNVSYQLHYIVGIICLLRPGLLPEDYVGKLFLNALRLQVSRMAQLVSPIAWSNSRLPAAKNASCKQLGEGLPMSVASFLRSTKTGHLSCVQMRKTSPIACR